MNNVIQAAAELQAVCLSEGWRFCFIGGIAQLRWGQPRTTVDADLSLLTGFGGELPYVQTLLKHFAARLPDAEEFALQRRVLLLSSPSGVGLDVTLAALPYEEQVIERSSMFDYPSRVRLQTCSAEDLVVMKAFAARTQDWADIERVIARQAGKLDWSYIREQLAPLAELQGDPDRVAELERRRAAIDPTSPGDS